MLVQSPIPNTTVDKIRLKASRGIEANRRAELGQYFTPSRIAAFMASLFSIGKEARLLDAGAGVGSLSAAFLDRAQEMNSSVRIDAWEIDTRLLAYLKNTLTSYERKNHVLHSFRIHASDFIDDATFSVQMGGACYTHAILNPPYRKINTNSKHRRLLREVGVEVVNLYAAFAALAILLLETGGELVAILPRSFCNGPYYRPFRQLLISSCALRQIHLFESRSKAFKDDDVLQENVIIHIVKGGHQQKVIVSTSHDASFDDYVETHYAIDSILRPDDREIFIHVPTAESDTLHPICCTQTLAQLGLEVSTGPVVDFRVKGFWQNNTDGESAPLLYPHHFTNSKLCWPIVHKKPNALRRSSEVDKLLMPRGHYILVKRFSSKEERRRIVAYHLEPDAIDSTVIGFENHWNVIHKGKRGIDAQIAAGLTLFLNSTLLDNIFRVFSGHTQVNATDLRALKFPSLIQLQQLGLASSRHLMDQTAIDTLIDRLTQ